VARRKRTKAPRSRKARTSRARGRGFWIAVAVTGAALIAALLAVLLTDNGGSSDAAADLGPVHVHGLGVNPADGMLYIATHTGMWRLPPGADKAVPIGESRQDTMGFTIAGPDHFLGSGHPDNVDEPPLLGLIESVDRGATWRTISLLGQADFHVLRATGRRVYGYDVSGARLLVSDNGGATWTERTPPAPVVDLALDPTEPDAIVATTAAGLFASADAGRTWMAIGAEIGLVAWPARRGLFLMRGNGSVSVSSNSGRDWRQIGDVGGRPSAFLAHSPRELFAALHDGAIIQSLDGGRTWTTRTR
jgi:hypothetical protein